jgi:hypothetical protein
MKIKFVFKENILVVNACEVIKQLKHMFNNSENNVTSLHIAYGIENVIEIEVSRMTIELFFLLQTNATVHHVSDTGFPNPVKSEPEKMYNYIITGVQHCLYKEIVQAIKEDKSVKRISTDNTNEFVEIKFAGSWLSDLVIDCVFESEAKVETVLHDFATELDNAMTAWDCRIHSMTKGKTRSGMWKKKKGLSKLAEEITDEDSGKVFEKWIADTISPKWSRVILPEIADGRVFEKWIADKIKETYNELTPKDSGKVFEKWIADKISEMGGEPHYLKWSADDHMEQMGSGPSYLKWGKFDEAQKIKDDMAKEERVKEQRRARRKLLVDKQAKLIDWVCSMAPDHDFTGVGQIIFLNDKGNYCQTSSGFGDVNQVTFPREIAIDVCKKLNLGELSF